MTSRIIDAEIIEPKKDDKNLWQKVKKGFSVAGISVATVLLMFAGFKVMAAMQDEGAKTIDQLNNVVAEAQKSKRRLTITKNETEARLAIINSDIANLDVTITEAQLKIARLVNGEDAESVNSTGTGSSSAQSSFQ